MTLLLGAAASGAGTRRRQPCRRQAPAGLPPAVAGARPEIRVTAPSKGAILGFPVSIRLVAARQSNKASPSASG
jgi:hypothetical protein